MLCLSKKMDDMGSLAIRLAPRPVASSVSLLVFTPSARIASRHVSNRKSCMGVGFVVYVFNEDVSEAFANSSKALAVSRFCTTGADTSTTLTSVLCSILGLGCDIVGETSRYSGRGAKVTTVDCFNKRTVEPSKNDNCTSIDN